jgi:hypothetical protein
MVSKCLSSETFLNHGQTVRHFNYVSLHRQTDNGWGGGSTTILVLCGIVEHSVRVPGLTHLAATAIQVILAGGLVKILEAYLSPSRPLIGSALTACFGGVLLVLMAGASTPNTWIGTCG